MCHWRSWLLFLEKPVTELLVVGGNVVEQESVHPTYGLLRATAGLMRPTCNPRDEDASNCRHTVFLIMCSLSPAASNTQRSRPQHDPIPCCKLVTRRYTYLLNFQSLSAKCFCMQQEEGMWLLHDLFACEVLLRACELKGLQYLECRVATASCMELRRLGEENSQAVSGTVLTLP